MCAHENCARMTAFPGAAWTGLHHTPKSGKPTFLRQEGASEMADARLPINEHHPRTRQTDKPCRAECQVVCSHMDRHHQSFHRHTSHHPLVTSTHVNTCSTAHVNTCSTAKNTTGVGVIALQPCAKASPYTPKRRGGEDNTQTTRRLIHTVFHRAQVATSKTEPLLYFTLPYLTPRSKTPCRKAKQKLIAQGTPACSLLHARKKN
jgi:hypothetical protein